MSINVGHRAVVDDGDPRIQWGGDWFQWKDVGDIEVYGPPFLNTLHGFQSSRAYLFFSYYGELRLYSNSVMKWLKSLTPSYFPTQEGISRSLAP
jgi:hypothetical protein